jgi:hypothetical protein
LTEEVTANLSSEEAADLLLLKDAVAHGTPLWQYLREAGITGEAAQRRIRRHESNNMGGILYAEALDDSYGKGND